MKALKKYIVVLHKECGAATALGSDVDAMLGGLPAITCASVDTSGSHWAFVVRIPSGMSPAGTGRSHQSWWFANTDIATVFQLDGDTNPLGFSTS